MATSYGATYFLRAFIGRLAVTVTAFPRNIRVALWLRRPRLDWSFIGLTTIGRSGQSLPRTATLCLERALDPIP